MISLLLWNKIDLMIYICLIIASFYLLKKFFIRQFIDRKKKNTRNMDDDDEDDDIPFRSNIDKRSLRPSYTRFMRRKLQEDLNHNPYLCVICWNDRKNIVLLPCRHLCVCVSCSQKLWNNTKKETCPICRQDVENLIEVFV
jgi:hypothetical protein